MRHRLGKSVLDPGRRIIFFSLLQPVGQHRRQRPNVFLVQFENIRALGRLGFRFGGWRFKNFNRSSSSSRFF